MEKALVLQQGLSTLHTGLAIVSLFETFLSALRAYVLAHTGAKVDVTGGHHGPARVQAAPPAIEQYPC